MTSSTQLFAGETWNTELAARPKSGIDWVWPGYLARGAVTLLTSQWKTGKTTLVSVLIAKMARGGELAGQTVRPARVAVASEEPLDFWQRRGEKLRLRRGALLLLPAVCGQADAGRLGRAGRPAGRAGPPARHRCGDPRSAGRACCRPGRRTRPAAMLQVLSRLSPPDAAGASRARAAPSDQGGGSTAGQLARGCGALCAFVDILMEMSLVTSALETDRRRRIAAWSRFEETPRRRLVELSADGRDYRAIPEAEQEDSFSRHWPAVERLLAFPPRKLTRQELLVGLAGQGHGPQSHDAVAGPGPRGGSGPACCAREPGPCSDPFRYWLAVLPAEWETQDDPAADYWPLVQHLLSFPPRKMSQPQLLRQVAQGRRACPTRRCWTPACSGPSPRAACFKKAAAAAATPCVTSSTASTPPGNPTSPSC